MLVSIICYLLFYNYFLDLEKENRRKFKYFFLTMVIMLIPYVLLFKYTQFEIDILDSKIHIVLSEDKLDEISMTAEELSKIVAKTSKISNIKTDGNALIVKCTSRDDNLDEVYKIKEKLKNAFISGIKGISHVLIVKEDDEYVILTSGTNLKEVFTLPFVDLSRTYSNDIREIAAVLGIEAARQSILNEVLGVIGSQGLNVDSRHIMLIADAMCAQGEIVSFIIISG